MYSFKQRKKAVDLYIKYGCNTAAVKRELGYPDRHVLVSWYKEYLKEGKLRKDHWRKKYSTSNYSEKQMKYAVKYYLEHGKNLNATINKLGYPQRARTLSGWLSFYAPKEKRVYRTSTIKYPQEVKEQAVIDLFTEYIKKEEL
mgnify:CR=1 FL=1